MAHRLKSPTVFRALPPEVSHQRREARKVQKGKRPADGSGGILWDQLAGKLEVHVP